LRGPAEAKPPSLGAPVPLWSADRYRRRGDQGSDLGWGGPNVAEPATAFAQLKAPLSWSKQWDPARSVWLWVHAPAAGAVVERGQERVLGW